MNTLADAAQGVVWPGQFSAMRIDEVAQLSFRPA
jgi:hypothetical protein